MLTKAENAEIHSKWGRARRWVSCLRRYWHPIAAVAELDENPIKPVRLMGEDLVLYKDTPATTGWWIGTVRTAARTCSYGWVEDCGIRCNYHGWKFDETGAASISRLKKSRIRTPIQGSRQHQGVSARRQKLA